ncbi:hypothetical protein ACIBCR_15925 [Micromonospora echinospora]|uniref:hypothetical protein n=1 Tax=Micromonospora echinospora TaxID=1877 RepID=UPI0037B1EA58
MLLLWQVVPEATAFFRRPLDEQDQRASVLSMIMNAIGLLVSLAGLVVSFRQARGAVAPGGPGSTVETASGPGGGQEQRDRAARDRLDAYLGPQSGLRRLGEEGASLALALRVHQAIELPPDAAALVRDADERPFPRCRRRHPVPATEPATLDPVLPTWVAREQEPRVREFLTKARQSGGFLVLVGDSSVGKTRMLYETASTVLDGWAVLAPALGDGGLLNLTATARFELPPLAVWLDELHRFLDGPYLAPGSTPITAETIRLLLDRPTPVVILGTMWPEHVQTLRAVDTELVTRQQRPRHPAALDVLDHRLCHTVTLGGFSAGERAAAEALADADPRLAVAVADRHFNVTEALAGAPEIMRRYEQGTPSQQAILHAAVDARRLGVQAPLAIELLAAAARGHPGIVSPDDDWATAAVHELSRRTGPTDRSTAPLLLVADPARRTVVGYDVADYLLQRLTESRRDQRVPAVTWEALVAHVTDPHDAERLARSAHDRLLYGYAVSIFWRAFRAGRLLELDDFSGLLLTPEQLEILRREADYGDPDAYSQLIRVLVARGDVEGLRLYADSNEYSARSRLAAVLAARGDLVGLGSRADAGDDLAAEELAEVLIARGDLDGLRSRAESGDERAGQRLAEVLVAKGDLDELRARADAGDRAAQQQLTKLLVARGDLVGLRSRADAGDDLAAAKLAEVLVAQGDLDGLRARAESGDRDAQWQLAEALTAQGDLDGLVALADADDHAARTWLVELLVARGDLVGLRSRADAGDGWAAAKLARVLVARDELDELRARADSGESNGARLQWLKVLIARGDADELRLWVDRGAHYASEYFAYVLEQRGDVRKAQQVRQFGLPLDA